MSTLAPSGAPTVVGSFPHTDAEGLVESLLKRLPVLPAWPQLPGRDLRERMDVQCSEGLPGVVVDHDREQIFVRVDDHFAEHLEAFYSAVAAGDVDRFAIGRDYARGLHLFLEALARRPGPRPAWVKGQVTGPFTFAMTVTDEGQRPLADTPELYEVAVQGLTMKARWMARTLRGVADNALVVLDEPCLCSFGSAVVTLSREELTAALEGAVEAIHAEGVLCGLHCCGHTDWSLVLRTGVDVVSFDAHDYFQGLSLYPTELGAFVERGGVLSWGIVPTSTVAAELGAEALWRELTDHIDVLARQGLPREALVRQSLLTPACGLGTRSVGEAEHVLDVLAEVAALWQTRGV